MNLDRLVVVNKKRFDEKDLFFFNIFYVQGRNRSFVENVANQLGLEEGSYVPHTYIEEIPLERRGLPDDLKTQLSLITIPQASADSRMNYHHGMLEASAPASSSATLQIQGVITELLEQITTLNERMNDLASHLEDLNSKIAASGALPVQNLSLSPSSSQLGIESALREEIVRIGGELRQTMVKMGTLGNLVEEYVEERSRVERVDSTTQNLESSTVPVLLALTIGCLGILAFGYLK
ncbi:unnamed protein product [Eruca vesicaria subsp. sativa]|uniref:Uncharacterized protein n=1 Tax=Eruca vesicaria subsp. sativa TaxID=29727 RepID=A0ABC8KJZ2_ERUVS|nr:unnamed protein product [Eruca vesicaria subsp. sativa]